jgi:hypothetical protein
LAQEHPYWHSWAFASYKEEADVSLAAFDERQPFVKSQRITPGDGDDHLTITSSPYRDYRIDVLNISNRDSIDHEVEIYVTDGVDEFLYGSVLIPAGLGFNADQTSNANNYCPADSDVSWRLPAGAELRLSCPVDVTADGWVYAVALGGYF